jgi:hypothetical protein
VYSDLGLRQSLQMDSLVRLWFVWELLFGMVINPGLWSEWAMIDDR